MISRFTCELRLERTKAGASSTRSRVFFDGGEIAPRISGERGGGGGRASLALHGHP